LKTDNFLPEAKDSRMRSLDNAMADLSAKYRGMTYEIQPKSRKRWILSVYNECVPGSYLKIEILDQNGVPAALVMERRSLGYPSMSRFMNRLMDALDPPAWESADFVDPGEDD
jgi:hypothetical protein